MKPEMILQADMLDILFESRNKAYGAYVLRKNYNGRLYKAISGMLVLVLLFILFNYWKNDSPPQAVITTINIPPDIKLKEVDIEKPKLPIQPKPPAAMIQHTTPLIVDHAVATVPENAELDKDVNIGTQTIDGPPASGGSNTLPSDNIGNNIEPATPEPKEPTVYESVGEMPEYPGGEVALRRFLHKNLRFDFDEMEAGSQVEIRCRFVVDKDGNVSGIEIIKSGGRTEYDKEVTRVVTKMPQWKPGIQHGRNVAVYFTLPVIVKVPE